MTKGCSICRNYEKMRGNILSQIDTVKKLIDTIDEMERTAALMEKGKSRNELEEAIRKAKKGILEYITGIDRVWVDINRFIEAM